MKEASFKVVNVNVSWGGETPGAALAGEVIDLSLIPETILDRWEQKEIFKEVEGDENS